MCNQVHTCQYFWHTPQQPFAAEIRVVVPYTEKSPLAPFMVAYRSMRGIAISPVCYLANIKITNRKDVLASINSYSLHVSDDETGPWTSIPAIPLISTSLYHVGAVTPSATHKGSILFPRGTYRLGTSMQSDDLRNSHPIEATPLLDLELQRSIPAHDTIQGWAAFGGSSSKYYKLGRVDDFFISK